MNVIVIGAGAMGLSAAEFCADRGFAVTVIEADSVPGGMAASSRFGDVELDRYYHFHSRDDTRLIEKAEELNLSGAMRSKVVRMAYLFDSGLRGFDSVTDIFTARNLSWYEKLRCLFFGFRMSYFGVSESLNGKSASDWLRSWLGIGVYEKLWRRLLYRKFQDRSQYISAAWIASRIKRVARAKKILGGEEYWVFGGGCGQFINTYEQQLKSRGVEFRYNSKVRSFRYSEKRIAEVICETGSFQCDAVISTIPMPSLTKIMERDRFLFIDRISSIKSVGVVCAVFVLRNSLTPFFWINTVCDDTDVAGIIEYSNLRPMERVVVYVPFYRASSDSKWLDDDYFYSQCYSMFEQINKDFSSKWIVNSGLKRYSYAQPVCEANFQELVCNVDTLELENFVFGDTSFYFPSDRGLSESIDFGGYLAQRLSHKINRADDFDSEN